MNDDQIIKTQLENAPQEIKTLLASDAWKNKLVNIAKSNSLSGDQMNELENEVLFVLLGLDLASNLAKNIQDNVEVSSIVAGGITLDIIHEILNPILGFLPTTIEGAPTDTPQEIAKPKTLSEEILAASTSQSPALPQKPIEDEAGVHFEVEVEKPNLATPELPTAHDEISAPPVVPTPVQAAPVPEPVLQTPPPPAPTIATNTKLEEKAVAQAVEPDAASRVMVSQYKGQDPYREPIE